MLTLRGLANEWVVTTNSKKSTEVIVGIKISTGGPNDMFNYFFKKWLVFMNLFDIEFFTEINNNFFSYIS